MKIIVSVLDIGLEKIIVGVFIFSDDFWFVFNFNDFIIKEDILGVVDNVLYFRGGIDIGFVFKNIREYGFRLVCFNVVYILIVVMDGLLCDLFDIFL